MLERLVAFALNNRLFVVLLFVLVSGLGLAEAAEAKVVVGSGTLGSEWKGLERLECREAEVSITGRGVGVIVIKGAAVVKAEGHGRRMDQPNGTVYLYGWKDSFFIIVLIHHSYRAQSDLSLR